MKKLLAVLLLNVSTFSVAHAQTNYDINCATRFQRASETLAVHTADYIQHYSSPFEFRVITMALRAKVAAEGAICVVADYNNRRKTALESDRRDYLALNGKVIRGLDEGRGDIYFIGVLAEFGFRSIF